MWMTDYIREVKRQLRDTYKFVPLTNGNSDLVFAEGQIPDGKYPMEIEGKMDWVRIEDGKIHCCNFETIEEMRKGISA